MEFSRDTEPMYVYVCMLINRWIDREIKRKRKRDGDFKELSQATMATGKSEICREGQEARDPGKH